MLRQAWCSSAGASRGASSAMLRQGATKKFCPAATTMGKRCAPPTWTHRWYANSNKPGAEQSGPTASPTRHERYASVGPRGRILESEVTANRHKHQGVFAERHEDTAVKRTEYERQFYGSPERLDDTMGWFYETLDRVYPVIDPALFKMQVNTSTASWLYPYAPITPLEIHNLEEFTASHRAGEFMDNESWKEQWKQLSAIAPKFSKRPPNPLPRDVHKIIDYKNLHFLRMFISPGGQILNPKYTGVKRKTQRKIAKMIKRARFLGLIPFTGHPFHEERHSLRRHSGHAHQDQVSKFRRKLVFEDALGVRAHYLTDQELNRLEKIRAAQQEAQQEGEEANLDETAEDGEDAYEQQDEDFTDSMAGDSRAPYYSSDIHDN